jgi:hypothetical protein
VLKFGTHDQTVMVVGVFIALVISAWVTGVSLELDALGAVHPVSSKVEIAAMDPSVTAVRVALLRMSSYSFVRSGCRL